MIEPAEAPKKTSEGKKRVRSDTDFMEKLARLEETLDEEVLKGTACIDRASLDLEDLEQKAAKSTAKIKVKPGKKSGREDAAS